MLRALHAGRAAAGRLGAAARPLSMWAEPSSAVPTTSALQRTNHSIPPPPRRRYHKSAPLPKSADGVHVSFESGGSSDAAKSEPAKGSGDSAAASGSACSQGVPDVADEEEEEQEEMFVTADPVLGHGSRQEWGGPRRGGRLAEPTRFGDWERKGRCTDF